MRITDEELEALDAIEKSATPGDWFAVRGGAARERPLCPIGTDPDGDIGLSDAEREHTDHQNWTVGGVAGQPGWETDGGYCGYGICEHDARFIAAARNALPRLIAEVRELREHPALLGAHLEGDGPERIVGALVQRLGGRIRLDRAELADLHGRTLRVEHEPMGFGIRIGVVGAASPPVDDCGPAGVVDYGAIAEAAFREEIRRLTALTPGGDPQRIPAPIASDGWAAAARAVLAQRSLVAGGRGAAP